MVDVNKLGFLYKEKRVKSSKGHVLFKKICDYQRCVQGCDWRKVWIPCGYPQEEHSGVLLYHTIPISKPPSLSTFSGCTHVFYTSSSPFWFDITPFIPVIMHVIQSDICNELHKLASKVVLMVCLWGFFYSFPYSWSRENHKGVIGPCPALAVLTQIHRAQPTLHPAQIR